MNEEKKKNRGWVKNVAIIFLVVLLLLTFFSNTIMNRSLPEVSVKYAEGGTITTQIRGTGTVEAVETYDVTIQETRKIKTVAVKAGQAVAAGDLLFILAEGDSSELETARDALDAAELAYQKAVINASEFDYAKENRNIQKLKGQISEAEAERDEYYVSPGAYTAAKEAVTTAKANVTTCEAAVEKAKLQVEAAQDDLNAVSQGNANYAPVTAAFQALEKAKKAVSDAEALLETDMLLYGADYNFVKSAAETQIVGTAEYQALATDAEKTSYMAEKLPIYMTYVATTYKSATDDTIKYYNAYVTITGDEEDIADAKASVTSAQANYDAAIQQYFNDSYSDTLYKAYLNNLESAKDLQTASEKKLTAAKTAQSDAEKKVEELDTKKASYKTAAKTVTDLTNTLEDAIFDLSQTQKTNEDTLAIQELDLQAMRDDIADQRAKIAKLESGSAGGEIYSEVDGTVKAVNVSAGTNTEYNQVLATVEVSGRGFKTEMTVTAEQAKKVSVGDFATVSTGYWGSSDITARLSGVRNDPKDPRASRILVFEVSGEDVETGSQLSLAIGEKSRSYEVIVPNSALRSDSNGDFVYIVTAKPSPLGNRYSATRVDVQVQAKDDVNSAITGGVSAYDYVITTSTKPIENKMLVRMAES